MVWSKWLGQPQARSQLALQAGCLQLRAVTQGSGQLLGL